MLKILIVLNFLLMNCNSNSSKQNEMENRDEFEVNFHQVICQGESNQWCWQVKSKNDKSWTFKYEPIEGLNFEWGYRYFVNIDQQTIKNPPQDGSSIKWKLRSVSKKEKMPPNTTFILELNGELPLYNSKTGKLKILDKEFDMNKNVKVSTLKSAKKVKFQIKESNKIEVIEFI